MGCQLTPKPIWRREACRARNPWVSAARFFTCPLVGGSGDQYSGRIVRVANSFVFKEPVFNYSGDFPFVWDEVVVPVRYGSDPRLARELIDRAVLEVVGEYVPQATAAREKMVRKYRIEDARIDSMVMLIANDNWLEFTARYVVDFKRRRVVKDEIFSKLLDSFEATAGRVLWASATFELTAAPPLGMNLRARRRPAIEGQNPKSTGPESPHNRTISSMHRRLPHNPPSFRQRHEVVAVESFRSPRR